MNGPKQPRTKYVKYLNLIKLFVIGNGGDPTRSEIQKVDEIANLRNEVIRGVPESKSLLEAIDQLSIGSVPDWSDGVLGLRWHESNEQVNISQVGPLLHSRMLEAWPAFQDSGQVEVNVLISELLKEALSTRQSWVKTVKHYTEIERFDLAFQTAVESNNTPPT